MTMTMTKASQESILVGCGTIKIKGLFAYTILDNISLESETPVSLCRDPRNEYDSNAIQVQIKGGSVVGNVSRVQAKILAKVMDRHHCSIHIMGDEARSDVKNLHNALHGNSCFKLTSEFRGLFQACCCFHLSCYMTPNKALLPAIPL
jgi:hypothetical protein